jgi:hypothetical protein
MPHPSKSRGLRPGRVDAVAERAVGLRDMASTLPGAECLVRSACAGQPSNGAEIMLERCFAQMTFFGTSVALDTTVAAAEVLLALCMHT